MHKCAHNFLAGWAKSIMIEVLYRFVFFVRLSYSHGKSGQYIIVTIK